MSKYGLTYNDVPPLGKCPICGSPVLRIWDKAICSERGCDYYKELDTMTGHDADGTIYIMDKPGDDE